MKKIITLFLLIGTINLSFSQILFQSNFQNWAGGVPTDWFGSSSTIANASVLQYFTGSSYGTYLCGLQNSTTSGTGLATQSQTVVGGTTYKLEIFVESTQGDMAIGYYDVTNSTYGTVSAYRSVVSPSTGILVIDSLTVPATCTSAQFLIYAKNTPAFGIGNIGVNLDRVVISVLSSPPPPPPPAGPVYDTLSIYEIQHTTATSGNSPYEDSLVQTSGIVTATHSNGYWIQDSARAWNGIYIFDNTNTPALGDEIIVRAEVDEFFNLTGLKNVDTLITVSSGNSLPPPIAITTTELSSEEKYEGVLCKVTSATCVNPSAGNGEWKILNSTDTAVVDDLIYAFTPLMGSVYQVTGIVHYSFGEYKLEPRDMQDIIRLSSISLIENEHLVFDVFPNPSSEFVSLSGINSGFVQIFSTDGKLISNQYIANSQTINISNLKSGVYILKISSDNKVGTTKFIKQ